MIYWPQPRKQEIKGWSDPWTDEDIAILTKRYERGEAIKVVAGILNRTDNSIKRKVSELGLKVPEELRGGRQLSISIPDIVRERLRVEARRQNLTMNRLVRIMLMDGLTRYQDDAKKSLDNVPE